jgi:1,4-dihydroxy-2-naphthoyl-CoA hydrolase
VSAATPPPAPEPHELIEMMPFAGLLGIVVETASPELVAGGLQYVPELCTAGGTVHGGVLMGLADSLGAICAYLNLPPGARTATMTSSTNFLRPAGAGSVTGTATPVHVGRTVIVVRVDMADAAGRLVATTTQTQAVLPASGAREGTA